MTYRQSLERAGLVLDNSLRERIAQYAHDLAGPIGQALARAGVSPTELEAGLAGKDMPNAKFAEAAGGERNLLLEAIILRVGRPSYLIRHGKVDWSTSVPYKDDIKAAVCALRPKFTTVGRVDLVNHPRLSWAGTAWLVESPEGILAITNRHVAQEFAMLRSDGRAIFSTDPQTLVPIKASIDFRRELGTPDVQEVGVKAIRYLARPNDPDIALLVLEPNRYLTAALQLSEHEAVADQPIVTIGYPARDSRNAFDAQHDIFGDVFDLKRLAPGRIMQATGPDSLLRHDASTLGGASGSPLIDLASGKVVGLHFSGRYLEANSAVSIRSIKAALAGTVVPVPAPSPILEGRADGKHDAVYFAGRLGYASNFLAEGLTDAPANVAAALAVPLPSVPTGTLAELIDRPGDHELRYTHFSVLYDRERRCPRMTAVNIDGGTAVKIRRGADRWFADLRIDPAIQLGSKDFVGELDRGHLVRREDPNWGTPGIAEIADSDTFHYTNAALQHALFNRNRQRWLGLEDYILRSTQTYGFRACVFAGPILEDNDPTLIGRPDLQVQRAFWKVVTMVAASGDRLHATGYVLGQAEFVQSMTESAFEFGDFNLYQVPIARIAAATGIAFDDLSPFDPVRQLADSESTSGTALLIETLDQIQL